MTTGFQRAIRVTVRLELTGSSIKTPTPTADLSIPTTSSLADALEDILQLMDAPMINRPWQARTAAGRELDPCIPLSEIGLHPGSIIVLSPQQDLPAPILRDAAESLLDVPVTFNPMGLAASVSATSLICLGILMWKSSLPTLSPPLLLGMLALICTVMITWLRALPPPIPGIKTDVLASGFWAIAIWLLATLSTFRLINEHRPVEPSQPIAWTLIAAVASGCVLLAMLSPIAEPPMLVLAGIATFSLLLLAGATSMLVLHSYSAVAALVVAICLIALPFLPTISIMLAGLSVPQLPSAGQDLKVSDRVIVDPAAKAIRATTLLDGQMLGLGVGASLAIAVVGWNGGAFGTALCLTSLAAVLLHAVRHRSPLAMWGMWIWVLAGTCSAVLSTRSSHTNEALLFLVILCLIVGMTAPLWAARVRTLPATSLNWLEKAETLAIAAAIPLALHIVGVFDAIRGLG